MKKHYILFIACCFAALNAWADTSVTENFSNVVQGSAVASDTWTGDVCNWSTAYARHKDSSAQGNNDVIVRNEQNIYCVWMSAEANDKQGQIQTTNLMGGIKSVSFDWAQFGGEGGNTLKLKVEAGDVVHNPAITRNGSSGENRTTGGDTYTHLFENKSNCQLIITNVSEKGGNNACRILIANITITPYLLYTTKEASAKLVGGTVTYTNNDLIDNTGAEGTITYALTSNPISATIDPSTGAVTATQEGEVEVTATWSEGASTKYTLTIVAKQDVEASYAEAIKRVGLDALAIVNTVTYTDGYDGTIAYSSSNADVATIASNGTVSLVGGVGQTTITATLPETENYKGTTASYILYVRDNNARIEQFSNVSQPGVVGNILTDLSGDLFTWQAQYQVRRGTNDTIHAGTTKHQATSIGVNTNPAAPSILQSKEAVEGGIKYLSFYWAQWGAAGGCTRRIVVYADGTKIGEQEHPNGAAGQNGDEFFLAINNAMKSNKQLIIKNESYKGTVETLADGASRIVMDNIYITPWLLYSDKSYKVMRIGDEPYKRAITNNTAGEDGTLTYTSSNTDVATVADDGTVTAVAIGVTTITAKFAWEGSEDFVETSYKLQVAPVNCETFSQNATAHTYMTADYGYAFDNPASVEEDKATWYTWLGGVVPSNYDPNVAVMRAPHTDEDGPAYIYSGSITGGIGSMTFDWNLVAAESSIDWDIRVFVNGNEVRKLGNEDLSMTVLPEFGQITIDNINVSGDFVIRFENRSTITGEYTSGNKARFVIDNIVWSSYSTPTAIDNTAAKRDIRKEIVNGQLVITKNGVQYNVLGTKL